MQKYILLSLALFIFSCTPSSTQKMSQKDTSQCTTMATVKDFTGLDGCRFLFVLENGDKYLPTSINDATFVLKDNQKIKFGYKEIEGAMSICMAEKKSIEVSCIKLISAPEAPPTKRPARKDCINTDTPLKIDWMKTMIQTNKISRVDKFSFRDGFAYLFAATNQFYLLDCQGTTLCSGALSEEKDCISRYIEDISSRKNIWKKA